MEDNEQLLDKRGRKHGADLRQDEANRLTQYRKNVPSPNIISLY